MKKILLILLIFLLLTSCSKSVGVNIDVFEKNINKVFEYEIFTQDNIYTVDESGAEVSYWLPKDYNICCALYTDKETGIITKYTLTSFSDSSDFKEFNNKFERGVCANNDHIEISAFEADGIFTVIYEDIRYKEKSENLTLKSEIDKDDLNYPVLENTSKPEN